MDLKDLEREELFELVDVLGDKLGKSIRQECVLILRVKGLERALDEAASDARRLDVGQNEYVVRLLKAEKRIAELEEANASLAETGKGHMKQAEELGKQLKDAETLNHTNVQVINNLRKTLEDVRSSLTIKETDVRRLERELRENRASVMNELSAMIPKAVDAEREACADLARAEALMAGYTSDANFAMGIVNKINGRGK